MRQRPVFMVLLLLVITCGLYWPFWAYLTRSELRDYLRDESISPGLEVLLCILCFPYAYYWIYKYSQDLRRAEVQAGLVENDNALLNVLLWFLGLGVVSILIIQSQLNAVAAEK